MKKVVKENFKIIIIVVITAIVTSSITGVYAYSYAAKDIEYNPRDTSWNVNNVEDAIKSLKNDKGGVSNNYSTNEQVIGTWIDGKPVYQKTLVYNQTFGAGTITRVNNGVSNLKEYISITGTAFRKDGSNYHIPSSYYANASWNMDVTDARETSLAVQVGSSYTGNYAIVKLYVTIQYTKTTD